MLKIIFKKLIFIPIASFIVSSLAFLVVNVTPGDPVEVIAGGIASEETKNEIRAELGLDKNLSIWEPNPFWLKRLFYLKKTFWKKIIKRMMKFTQFIS